LADDACYVGDGAFVDDAAVGEWRDLFDGGEGFLGGPAAGEAVGGAASVRLSVNGTDNIFKESFFA
jgi:hypothetical protein